MAPYGTLWVPMGLPVSVAPPLAVAPPTPYSPSHVRPSTLSLGPAPSPTTPRASPPPFPIMHRTSGMRRSLGPHFRRSLCVSGPVAPAAPAAVPAFFPGGALPGGVPAPTPAPQLLRASSPALRERLSGSAAVFAAFVSPAEGAAVLREAEEALRRRRYEDGHWDGVSGGKGQRSRGRGAVWGLGEGRSVG